MVAPGEKPNYNSYLLRIWRPDPLTPWRILVENIPTRERKGVRNWNELLEFLLADVASPTPPAQQDGTAEETDGSNKISNSASRAGN